MWHRSLLLATAAACAACDAPPAAPSDGGFAVRASVAAPLVFEVSGVTADGCAVRAAYGPSGAEARRITAWTASGSRHRLLLVGLKAGVPHDVVVTTACATGDPVQEALQVTPDPLPADLPTVETHVAHRARVSPGLTVFGLTPREGQWPGTVLVGIDEDGDVAWYWRDGSEGRNDPALQALPEGNLLVLLPTGLRVITWAGETVADLPDSDGGFHHEAVGLPGGLLGTLTGETAEVRVPVTGQVERISADIARVLDRAGRVAWEWRALDHLDTQRFESPLSQVPSSTGTYEWTHANALVLDPADGNYLVSLRNQDWIVKVSAATGEVLWRLGAGGDFTLAEGRWFSAQHAPEVHPDGALLLYDNGANALLTPGRESRALLLRLDEAKRTARIEWEYRTPYYTAFLGDADLLPNGNVLVAAGGQGRGDPPAEVLEVIPSEGNAVAWRVSTGSASIYRAVRVSPAAWGNEGSPGWGP